MPVKRISDLNSAVNLQGTDLLVIVNGSETRKTTVTELSNVLAGSSQSNIACRVATTANITLSNTQTIDGVAVGTDDRVLVWKQTNAQQNGIYVVSNGAWARALDFDAAAEIRSGALVSVVAGNAYKQSIFQLTTLGSVIVNTTPITFSRITGWTFNESTNIVSLTNRAVHVPSLQINGGLAKYDAEHHNLYDNRTLVDKEYVDDKVTEVDSPWGITGSNVFYTDGNVGIGTNTPTADLHVEGTLRFVDGNQVNGKVLTSDNNGVASWQAIPVNALWSPGTGSNIYYNLGMVGIGTANPTAALHVAGSIRMVDGNQAAGKVLTSNAQGVASWQDAPVPPAGTFWLLEGTSEPTGDIIIDSGGLYATQLTGLTGFEVSAENVGLIATSVFEIDGDEVLIYADGSEIEMTEDIRFNANNDITIFTGSESTDLYLGARGFGAFATAQLNVRDVAGVGTIRVKTNGSGAMLYEGDYSANFIARSLIDKGYADATYAPISGANSWNLATGGTLTGHNTIAGNFNKFFTGTGGFVIGHSALTTANTRLQIRGTGTTTNILGLFEDSGGAERFKMLDNGMTTFASDAVAGSNPGPFEFKLVNSDNAGRYIATFSKSNNGAANGNSGMRIGYRLDNSANTLVEMLLSNIHIKTATAGAETTSLSWHVKSAGATVSGLFMDDSSTGFGMNSNAATAGNTLAIGISSAALAYGGISIGNSAGNTTGTSNQFGISIGHNSNQGTSDIGNNSIALGNYSKATAIGAISIGYTTQSNTANSIAIGIQAEVSTANNGTAIGGLALVKAAEAISIGISAGNTSGTHGQYFISLGSNANAGTHNIGADSIAIGRLTKTQDLAAISIGRALTTSAAGAILMGWGNTGITNSTPDSFGLGWGSSTTPDILLAKTADMYINNTAGKFILGGNSPSAKLHVKGIGTTTGELFRLDNSGANKLLILDNGTFTLNAGGTFTVKDTNNIVFDNSIGGLYVDLISGATSDGYLRWFGTTNQRWQLGKAVTTSNFALTRFNASGVVQDVPFIVDASTGDITLAKKLLLTTAPSNDNSLTQLLVRDNSTGEIKYKTAGTRTVVTQNITGSVTIDLSTGDIFVLTLTGNVTSFDYSNAVVGKEYSFIFLKDTSNKTLTWTTGKYRFPFGNAPVLTDPTTNGTSGPANSKDIVTAICYDSGRLNVVITPDLINN